MKYIKKFNEKYDYETLENVISKSKVEEILQSFISFLEKEYPDEHFEVKKSYGYKKGEGMVPSWSLEYPITKYFVQYGQKFEYTDEFLNELNQVIDKSESEGLVCDYNLPEYYRKHLDRGTSAKERRFLGKINLLK